MAARHPFSEVRFSAVVYLGTGCGQGLDSLLEQIDANSWHLVEGDKEKHSRLQKATSELQANKNISLHKKVVSDDGSIKAWYGYNLNELSGLKKIKKIDDLFPGIMLKEKKSVDTISMPDFIAKLGLDSKDNNLLVIDLPGQVLELLDSMKSGGQHELFSNVVLTATTENIFENGDTLARLRGWLDEQGYHTRNEPFDDADFPVLYYALDKRNNAELTKLNETVIQLRQERDEALALASQLKQVTKERDNATVSIASVSKELEQVKKERDTALDEVLDTNQKLQQAKEEIEKVLSWNKSLKSDKESLTKRNQELISRQEDDAKQVNELTALLQKKADEYEQLRKQKNEVERDISKELSNLKRAFDGKSKALEEKEEQLRHYKSMEANYSREFYRVESQLELLKELISNGRD